MTRAMLRGPARDFIYYGVLSGAAIALTHIFYLYVNGLV